MVIICKRQLVTIKLNLMDKLIRIASISEQIFMYLNDMYNHLFGLTHFVIMMLFIAININYHLYY